jgi:hypothetical protein
VESSIYAFAEDMRAEGTVAVLDRVFGYGCDGVTVAAAYHRARDVTPHGHSGEVVEAAWDPGDDLSRLRDQ